jgi:hypothetical protein
MNHSFQSAKWSAKACNICARPESLHGNDVQCECCLNKGPIEIIGKIVMCSDCQERHKNTEVHGPSLEQKEKLSLEQVLNQVDRIVETQAIVNKDGESVKNIIDQAIQGNIKQYTDFFNATIPNIAELKEIINADESIESENKHYALMSALKRRVQYLSMVLFQTRNAQIEMSGEIKSIQHYMAETIPMLRMKLRAEFALNTPNYTPQVIKSAPKPRKTAQSASDKMAESYAKIMKIPIEQARRMIDNKLRDDCTCSETPGLCKVHSAISRTEKK